MIALSISSSMQMYCRISDRGILALWVLEYSTPCLGDCGEILYSIDAGWRGNTIKGFIAVPHSALKYSESSNLVLRSRRGLVVEEVMEKRENSALCLKMSCTLTPNGNIMDILGFVAYVKSPFLVVYVISSLTDISVTSCSRLNGILTFTVFPDSNPLKRRMLASVFLDISNFPAATTASLVSTLRPAVAARICSAQPCTSFRPDESSISKDRGRSNWWCLEAKSWMSKESGCWNMSSLGHLKKGSFLPRAAAIFSLSYLNMR